MYFDAIKIPQLSHEVFWNLIDIANCRVAEVNSLNLDKLPGRFFFKWPGYEATQSWTARTRTHSRVYPRVSTPIMYNV